MSFMFNLAAIIHDLFTIYEIHFVALYKGCLYKLIELNGETVFKLDL